MFSFFFIIDPIFIHRSKNDKRDLVAEYKKREGGKDMMNLVVIGMLDFMLSENLESHFIMYVLDLLVLMTHFNTFIQETLS